MTVLTDKTTKDSALWWEGNKRGLKYLQVEQDKWSFLRSKLIGSTMECSVLYISQFDSPCKLQICN
jgi:hypothetical protein